MVRPNYTRVAVAQLDFVPAAVIKRRSPLEDPLFGLHETDSLLPDTGSLPPQLHEPLQHLRARVRSTYVEQYWLKLEAVIAACRRWKVKLLVLPEYSVPWELLPRLAVAAGELVVVAGTHAVERAASRAGVYTQLGWAAPVESGTAVAPVLYQGRLIALQPKLSVAPPEQGSLKVGAEWQPIDTGGHAGPGLTGPMGVMICLDFLYREREVHREQVGPRLAQTRFLAVPSYTPWYTLDAFAATAWDEARRYKRPVLYANVASHGGSSLFVDEGQLVDLRRFPDHAGYLDRGDEGLIAADVDLGYWWAGSSTSYNQEAVVVPFAAASLVYRDRPLSDRYAQWSLDFDERLEQLDVDDAIDEIAAQRDLLLDAGSLEGAKVRKARLERLLLDLEHIADRQDLRRFLAEVVLPPDVLAPAMVRAALASGALETVRGWAAEYRLAGFEAVERRLMAGAKPAREIERATWTESGIATIASIASTVRGEIEAAPAEVKLEPVSRVPSDVPMGSFNKRARGFRLRFRATPDQLWADVFDPRKVSLRVGSFVVPAEDLAGPVRINYPRDDWFERLWLLRKARAEGAMSVVGVVREDADPVHVYVVIESSAGRRRLFANVSRDRSEAEQQLANDIHAAIAEVCADVDAIELVDSEEFERSCAELRHRFDGARAVVNSSVTRRLAELDNQSIGVDVLVEGESEPRPGIAALNAWGASRDQFALVLGKFGAGKSTLVGQWCQQLWDRTDLCPIFVDLAGARGGDPLGLLLAATDRDPSNDADRAALSLLIQTGDVIPCFDGFDEMTTSVGFAELSRRLAELLALGGDGGRILVSSRDHYFTTEGQATMTAVEAMQQAGIAGLWRAVVQPLVDEQVKALVAKVKGAEDVDAVLKKIETTYDLGDLVQTPLLLMMVIKTIDEIDPDAQVGPAAIYERYLERWLEQAETGEAELFSRAGKREFAEQLARELWRSGARSMGWAQLHRAVRDSMAPHIPVDVAPAAAILELQGGAFFVWDAADSFRFAHRSFLEYFVARALLQDLEVDVATTLTTRPITREVGAFVAELLRMAGSGREHPAIVAVERWLAGGRAVDPRGLEPTAEAAANTLRLLREVGRRFGDAGWVPDGADLRQADLHGEDLRGLRLHRVDVTQAVLVDVDLEGADLQGAVIVRTRMAGARLWSTCLDAALVDACDLLQVEAHEVSLRGARMVEADLRQSTWTDCDWWGVTLERVRVGPTWSNDPILDPTGDGLRPPLWLGRPSLRSGHSIVVWSVAWSPDGSRLASASFDKTVRVWSADDGRELAKLDGHSSAVQSVAWSPDGSRLASASHDNTVRVWSADGRSELVKLDGHANTVQSVAWSPDGSRLASASSDNTVRVWSADDGRELARLDGHSDFVQSVTWSPDGSRLASASSDKTVRVWSADDGRELAKLDGHSASVQSAAWSPDGSRLASASFDKTIRVWSADDGRELAKLDGHANTVQSVAWSPDGSRLASASSDKTVRVWSADDGRELDKLDSYSDALLSVAWSPDGSRLASASSDNTVRVWSTDDNLTLAKLDGHSNLVQTVAWSPDGSRLASASWDNTVRVWSADDGRELAKLDGHSSSVWSVAWSPDGSRLASASWDKTVRVWSTDDGSELAKFDGHSHFMQTVAWSPDGSRLALASSDRTVRVWSADDGRELAKLDGHSASVQSVAWSPDGSRLASASSDNTVRVWRAHDGRELAKLDGHSASVQSVAWSPDGSRFASASSDNTVRVWSADDGRELARLDGHSKSVQSVAWSPDGSRLASASSDKTVRVWRTDGRELARLDGHSDFVQSVTWSPDGSRLASASFDNTVRVWSVDDSRELATIEFIADSLLVRTNNGHMFVQRVGAAPPMLAITSEHGASISYLPLAGLRLRQHPEKVAAGFRDASFRAFTDLEGAPASRPWDGQVRWLTRAMSKAPEPAPPSEVPQVRINPFRPGPPLDGPSAPPGRDREMSELLSITASHGVAMLIGPRRAGKTSLLHAILHASANRRVYTCNLQAAPSKVRSADEIARLLSPDLVEAAHPALTFAARVAEERPLLLFDEVGVLSDLDTDDALYGWLRSLGQEHASIIYAGSRHDWNRVMDRVKHIPQASFGNETFEVELTEIPEHDAIRFLVETSPADARIPADPVARWVLDLCGAWPFYLQVLGHALVEEHAFGRRINALTKHDVEQLMRQKLLRDWDRRYFQSRWFDLPAPPRHLLLRELMQAVERKRHVLPGWSALARSERHVLRQAGLLERDGWRIDRPFLLWLFDNVDDLDVESEVHG